MTADIRIDAMVDCNFSFSVMRFGSSSFSNLRFGSNFYFKHFGSSFSVMRFGRCSFSVMRCGSNSASKAHMLKAWLDPRSNCHFLHGLGLTNRY